MVRSDTYLIITAGNLLESDISFKMIARYSASFSSIIGWIKSNLGIDF